MPCLAPWRGSESLDNGLDVGDTTGVLKTCLECGKQFEPYSRRRKAQRFCPGGKCYARWYHRTRRRVVPIKPKRPRSTRRHRGTEIQLAARHLEALRARQRAMKARSLSAVVRAWLEGESC